LTCWVHTYKNLLSCPQCGKSYPLATIQTIGNDQKKHSFSGGKHTQQVIPQINFHHFGLLHPLTSPLSNPTLPTPNFALYAPLWQCTVCHNNNPRQQGGDNDKGGRLEVFFFLQPTVFQIFLAITQYTSFNVVLFSSYRFFFIKLKSENSYF
jgi:hypothetical protein